MWVSSAHPHTYVPHSTLYSSHLPAFPSPLIHRQVAVALRVMADAELAEDTEGKTGNTYDDDTSEGLSWSGPEAALKRSEAEASSYRFWVTGCLSMEDRVEDGFFDIWGVSPHVWNLCSETTARGRMPALEALKALTPSDVSFDVTIVNSSRDRKLRELIDKAVEEGFSAADVPTLAKQLGMLVAKHFG